MNPLVTNSVLLLGATSPIGQQLLLKLAVGGFEVTAQVPQAAAIGETGEFAVQVAHCAPADALELEPATLVVAAEPLDWAEADALVTRLPQRVARWVQCASAADASALAHARLHCARLRAQGVATSLVRHAPTFAEVVGRVRAAGFVQRLWLARSRTQVAPVHEADVAHAATRALQQGLEEVAVTGPQSLTWGAIVGVVHTESGRRRGRVAPAQPAPDIHTLPGYLRRHHHVATPVAAPH